MKFCTNCAAPVTIEIPEGDNRERFVCHRCEIVHYQNPNVVVGALLTQGDKVLLCKRSIEPRYGYWTLPAGFLENGESARDGAKRETWEEACARVDELTLFAQIDVPDINQVHIFFRGELHGDFAAGEESLEVSLFSADEIPWSEIAFATVNHCLSRWAQAPDDHTMSKASRH